MKRLIRPLVYVLGFSVFCACTSTSLAPVADYPRDQLPKDLVLRLHDGSRVTILDAVVEAEDIHGLVTEQDSTQFAEYSGRWRLQHHGLVTSRDSVTRTFEVTIPKSDVRYVETRQQDHSWWIVVGLGVIVGAVVLAAKSCCSFDFD